MVTHAAHFISHRGIDRILLLVDGSNRFLGTWDDLVAFEPQDDNTERAVNYIKSHVREDAENSDDEKETEELEQLEKDSKKGTGRLMKEEEREHGLSSIKTWLLWFRRAGGKKFFFLQVLLMGFDRFIYVAIEWFLARWTSAVDRPVQIFHFEFPAQSDGFSAQSDYVKIYGILLLLMLVAVVLRSEWAVTGGGKLRSSVLVSLFEVQYTNVLYFL